MMFRGLNSVTLDAKGRIKLPARYRQLLPEQESLNVIVTIDTESPCLLVYPLREWEIIEEKLQRLPTFNPAARRIQRLLIGHATDCELDNSGRLLLPALLRDYANLEKEVRVVGQGKKMELWNANTWDEYRMTWMKELTKPDDLPEDLQSLSL